MSKIKLFSKFVPIILIVSILFTACDVPDISKFTEQSSEMTSGIRKGVKDTESVLKELVDELAQEKAAMVTEGGDLTTIEANLKIAGDNLTNYQAAMKGTLKTLDSLDTYLEALNALSQANKKSGDNAKAAVTAVSSLVTSVSELPIFPGAAVTLGDSTIKIATGLLALEEQFRTARSFKKRVNLASDIVEGRYKEVVKITLVDGVRKEKTEMEKVCTNESKTGIETANGKLAKRVLEIKKSTKFTDKEKEILIRSVEARFDKEVFEFGCGVIDLLKFTLGDLKQINNEALPLKFNNYKDKNELITGFYESIVSNDARVQNELRYILLYKETISKIKDTNSGGKPPIGQVEAVKRRLNNVFLLDGELKKTVKANLEKCYDAPLIKCGGMKDFLSSSTTEIRNNIYPKLTVEQWEYSTSAIESDFDSRASILFDQNAKYISDLERIKSNYSSVTGELKSISDRQKQMNKLLDASREALDIWIESHANLRVAVNSNKPLTVAKLTSKVKEIWAILEPEK